MHFRKRPCFDVELETWHSRGTSRTRPCGAIEKLFYAILISGRHLKDYARLVGSLPSSLPSTYSLGLPYPGSQAEIDELFPPRSLPVKATSQNEAALKSKPASTGVGFFTPDGGGGGNLFKTWKPEGQTQPFRIGLPHGPRDSLCVQSNDPRMNQLH